MLQLPVVAYRVIFLENYKCKWYINSKRKVSRRMYGDLWDGWLSLRPRPYAYVSVPDTIFLRRSSHKRPSLYLSRPWFTNQIGALAHETRLSWTYWIQYILTLLVVDEMLHTRSQHRRKAKIDEKMLSFSGSGSSNGVYLPHIDACLEVPRYSNVQRRGIFL